MSELRKQLRSLTAGAKVEFKKESIEWEGQSFEIRQPSVAIKSKIMQKSRISLDEEDKAASMDFGAMQIWSVIYCTYVPGTEELVFEEVDEATLSSKPSGSFVDKFAAIAMKLMNVEPDEAAKN